jgi:hypothetical protein
MSLSLQGASEQSKPINVQKSTIKLILAEIERCFSTSVTARLSSDEGMSISCRDTGPGDRLLTVANLKVERSILR